MFAALCGLALFCAGGCNLRQLAANGMADSMARSGDVFASDNDPQLIRDAAPFSLKLMESVLSEVPRHEGLLTAASRSFTQYAYAFISQDADELESRDIAAANAMRDRARGLLLRARDYGLRGLDVPHYGFSRQLRNNPRDTVRWAQKSDVELLYWTAAAWGAAITVSKNNPELVSDQIIVEALIDRALELDESFGKGAIHSFLITYEPARQGVGSTAESRARGHFDRAVELSGGQSASPYIALAETVCVQKQDRKEFESLLQKALAIDVNAQPNMRLENLIMQKRARWLLSRTSELFVE